VSRQPDAADSEGLFIGLMSGTSLDGVDGVLAHFSSAHPAGQARAHVHQPFPADLQAELLALNVPGGGPNELHRAQVAGLQVTQAYASVVAELLRLADCEASAVRAIGAHGQTVRHHPAVLPGMPCGYTVQVQAPAWLAERTGIDVVADFRSRDLAAGGQGAPLAPGYHLAALAKPGQAIAVLNLGGIANWTFVQADGVVTAFDCGPANVLMDGWTKRHLGQPFDRDGSWARNGKVSKHLLQLLLAEPYLKQPPPKSTGRELFNLAWLDDKLANLARSTGQGGPSPADVQATLAAFTAQSVAEAWRWAPPTVRHAAVCGGGAFNGHLLELLRQRLPAVEVVTTQALGVPPDQVEALAFAWLAWRFTQRRPGNLPAATGALGGRVLGALYPAA
jgi:anhydro-N-acetylmuramic acid kinase